MSLVDFLIGSVEENADRERFSYDPETGKRKKEIGDHIGDFIFRRGAALDKATKDAYVNNLKNTYGTQLRRYGNVVGGEEVSDLSRLTSKQVGNRLLSNKELKGARSEAGERTGEDITTFQDLNTPEAVRARAAKLVREKQEGKEAAKETKEENRYNEGVAYRKSRDNETDKRYDLEQQRMWENRQAERKDRALTREMNAENNAMQMQLEYSRLAQADAARAQDRKDKAIMALLGGLGNLGAAFTI